MGRWGFGFKMGGICGMHKRWARDARPYQNRSGIADR
jgi:hypothetical protein